MVQIVLGCYKLFRTCPNYFLIYPRSKRGFIILKAPFWAWSKLFWTITWTYKRTRHRIDRYLSKYLFATFLLILASICRKYNISFCGIWTLVEFFVHKCQKSVGCADVKVHFVFEAFDESFLHSSHNEALKKKVLMNSFVQIYIRDTKVLMTTVNIRSNNHFD